MEKKTDLGRGERMAVILTFLLQHRTQQFSITELMGRLAQPEEERRNLQRDLNSLAALPGSLVASHGKGTRLVWGIRADHAKGLMIPGSHDDLFNMILLERTAQRFPEMSGHLQGIVKIWRDTLPPMERKLFEQFDTILGTRIEFTGSNLEFKEKQNKHLIVFLQAIAQRRKVQVTYFGNEKEKPETSKRVAGMVVVNHGQIYIGCMSQSNPDAEYFLRLSRVHDAKLLGERAPDEPQRIERLRERIRTSGGILGDNQPKAERVKLLFPDYFHNILEEHRYHPSAKTRMVKGKIELRMEVEVNRTLKQWILGWAERVEVVEPRRLRDEMREFGELLVRRYIRNGGD